ncbi:MAG TPA: hypothetical protein EYH09_00765, partial [Candidatus Nanopusillus sp.]|nr:hypothetical protein [Candidatus Nanopusillus sp.]
MTEKTLDVILIGETHTDLKQAYEIAKIIKKYKPEYVLYEGFDKDYSSIVEKAGLSLQELCEKYQMPLEDMGLTKDVLNKDKLR